MSLIQKFLNRAGEGVARCTKVPESVHFSSIKSRYDLVKAEPVRFPQLKILQPFQTSAFPKDRSEIRGVDNVVHQQFQRQYKLKVFPPVMRNQFLSVQFFPRDHPLCNFRKSNISLVFNMHQIPMLNDRNLESGFKSRPKYKDLQFYTSKPSPMQSACGRTKSKKKFRELLISSLSSFSSHSKRDRLYGIFVFHVAKVPVNQTQYDVIARDLEKMCAEVLNNEKIWMNLKRGNKSKGKPMKNVQYSYGVKGLVDRRIRFPFLKKFNSK